MRQINKLSLSTKASSSSYSVSSNGFSLNRSNSTHNLPSTPATPSLKPTSNFGLQRSVSSNEVADVIETGRGFKPSDVQDTQKKQFLTDLTKRVFKVGLVSLIYK